MGYRSRFIRQRKKNETKAASPKVRNVQISENDLKILELISSRGCIHIPSIRANLGNKGYHPQSDEAMIRTLERLVSLGLIKCELTNARKQAEMIYYTGKRIPYNEISHALYMNEALDRILSNPRYSIVSDKHEHVLKSELSKAAYGNSSVENVELPDREVTLEKGGYVEHCYMEIDSKSYTGSVLRGKVAGLSKYIGNTPLYWICYSSKRLKTVANAVSEFSNIKPIMYYELNSL